MHCKRDARKICHFYHYYLSCFGTYNQIFSDFENKYIKLLGSPCLESNIYVIAVV